MVFANFSCSYGVCRGAPLVVANDDGWVERFSTNVDEWYLRDVERIHQTKGRRASSSRRHSCLWYDEEGWGVEGSGENKPREKDRERGDSDITNRTPYSHGGHYIRGYNEWQPARPAQPCHSSYVARCRSPFSISYASHNVRLCSLRSLSLLRFFVPCFLIFSYFINPSFPCRHVIKSLQVIAKDKNLILPLVNHLTDIINNKLPYDEKVDKNKKIRTPEFPPMAVCYKSFSSLPSHPLSSFLISISDFKLTIL